MASKKQLRSGDNKIFLVGKCEREILGAKLPSMKQVLQFFFIIATVEDITAFAEKDISDFVSAKTKRFFTRLQIDCSFLHSDPMTWKDRQDFCDGKRLCENLAVVNDSAERAVKLITDFNRALTYDEEDKQYLLQVVEHYRHMYPSHTKSSLVKLPYNACVSDTIAPGVVVE